MIFTAVATAPFVAYIHVWLPSYARRSQEALLDFARRPPADTGIELTKVGFSPLPRRRYAILSDLRMLPPKRFRYATMEHVSRAHQGKEVPGWMRAHLGQFYVRPGDVWTKTSRAPGVWQMLVDHLERNVLKPAGGTRRAHPSGMVSPARVVPRPYGSRQRK